jgi:xanthine dehydrogenase small subunit
LTGQKVTPALCDAAAKALAQDIAPIDDIRSTGEYRLAVAENLLRQFLADVAAPQGVLAGG